MLVLQANLILRDSEIESRIIELLASIQPPVSTKIFESCQQLSGYLNLNGQTGRQILITDDSENVIALNRKCQFISTILTGVECSEPSASIRSISRLPTTEEFVDAIQITYRIADQFYKLQSNADKVERLADRERRIIELAVEGLPNKAIASKLGISIKTVEKNRRNAYSKLNVTSAAEMASLLTFNRFCLFMSPFNVTSTPAT